jgi:2-polyprenyl-6-methoxyphenol hydroxylase-like FAD-dependent oxidoreductase
VPGQEFREYHVTVVFHAPLSFAYEWCTDYTPEDPAITGEDKAFGLQRRIVQRASDQVVFENIYDHGAGWAWERHTVSLRPPDRWHSNGYGNYHETHLDYHLSELPGNRTRFDLRWVSRPTGLATGTRSPRQTVERFVQRLWRLRGRALGRDYRKSQRTRRTRRNR